MALRKLACFLRILRTHGQQPRRMLRCFQGSAPVQEPMTGACTFGMCCCLFCTHAVFLSLPSFTTARLKHKCCYLACAMSASFPVRFAQIDRWLAIDSISHKHTMGGRHGQDVHPAAFPRLMMRAYVSSRFKNEVDRPSVSVTCDKVGYVVHSSTNCYRMSWSDPTI